MLSKNLRSYSYHKHLKSKDRKESFVYYPEEVLEEVRSRNDIVDVVSEYVKLQKKGSNHFGLCPFHNEKSPSFSVSSSKQMYYCFGCGVGGNVLTFVMEYENISFPEALKQLAERAGVKLPEVEYSKEDKARADLRTILLEINKHAANYFYYQLHQPQGKIGYDYFKNRKLSDETLKSFGLGYANKTSNDLYLYLKSKGYHDDILKESGLITPDERGTYDKFWNRVMFPILDVNHRVIGFGGRVMGEGNPKYLNSPETKIFDKSRNLYGLNYARTSRENTLIICEGYMDVIALHQAGFKNAVAALGTAFTSQHASLLKRYTDKVILSFDNDMAGIKATLRAIPLLKEAGISARVLKMEPYKDPDEFIEHLGTEVFKDRIEHAQNGFLFEVEIEKKNYVMEDPEQKTQFYNWVARKLIQFPEALERDNYTQAVSKEQFIPYDELKSLVNRLGQQFGVGTTVTETVLPKERKKTQDKEEGSKQAQRLLLTWLIEKPELFEKIKGIVGPRDFIEDLYQKVAAMVFESQETNTLNPAGILNHFINDDMQYKEVAALFNATLQESLNNEEQKKAFTEIVVRVRKNSLDYASRKATDIGELQEIIKQQAALNTLQIMLD